jgi:hypothetical protein
MLSMKQETVYPRWKVIISFSFCPAIGGVIYALFSIVPKASFQDRIIIELLGIIISVLYFFPVSAQVLYCPPAIVLACYYYRLRLYKSIKSVLFVALMGGFGASGYTFIFAVFSHGYSTFFSWEMLSFPFSFIMGFVSSLLVGLLVLPSKRPIN